jgi:hypothetical protein
MERRHSETTLLPLAAHAHASARVKIEQRNWELELGVGIGIGIKIGIGCGTEDQIPKIRIDGIRNTKRNILDGQFQGKAVERQRQSLRRS